MNNEKDMSCWEFLNSARAAHFDAARYNKRVKELEIRCEKVTAELSGMPNGGKDRHGDALWAALSDLREQWMLLYTEAVRNEVKVDEFVRKIENFDQRIVLQLRYVDRLRWPDVLRDLERFGIYCSEREMFRTHREALLSAKILWNSTRKVEAE